MVKFQFSNRKESQTHNIILNLLCPGPGVSIIPPPNVFVYNNFFGIYVVVNWNWSGTEMGCRIPLKIRIEFYLSSIGVWTGGSFWSEDEYLPFFHTFLLDFLDCWCYCRIKLYEFNSFAIHNLFGAGVCCGVGFSVKGRFCGRADGISTKCLLSVPRLQSNKPEAKYNNNSRKGEWERQQN